jgi:hypothetical protein
MAINELKITVGIKYPKILFAINIIPVLLGLKAIVPSFFVEVKGP